MTRIATRAPVFFAGHGNPMNAIEDNRWSAGFAGLAEGLEKPRAMLAISAHWYIEGTLVTSNDPQPTIHDFGGFPPALYDVQYPVAGDVELARRVASLLECRDTDLSDDWGCDHGTWSVLVHMLPEADVPVVQVSIDRQLGAAEHLALGRALAPLRDEGVVLLASGNVVHNLRDAFGRWKSGNDETPSWASEFDEAVASAIERRDHDRLAELLDSELGRRAHPTPDHYLPLLYAVGATEPGDAIRTMVEGFDMGSLSMRCVRWG